MPATSSPAVDSLRDSIRDLNYALSRSASLTAENADEAEAAFSAIAQSDSLNGLAVSRLEIRRAALDAIETVRGMIHARSIQSTAAAWKLLDAKAFAARNALASIDRTLWINLNEASPTAARTKPTNAVADTSKLDTILATLPTKAVAIAMDKQRLVKLEERDRLRRLANRVRQFVESDLEPGHDFWQGWAERLVEYGQELKRQFLDRLPDLIGDGPASSPREFAVELLRLAVAGEQGEIAAKLKQLRTFAETLGNHGIAGEYANHVFEELRGGTVFSEIDERAFSFLAEAADKAHAAKPSPATSEPAANANGGSEGEIVVYVTLDQAAATVQRSKKTLENWRNRKTNPLPEPDIEGGGGKPNEWVWSKLRPWLENETGKALPAKLPSFRR